MAFGLKTLAPACRANAPRVTADLERPGGSGGCPSALPEDLARKRADHARRQVPRCLALRARDGHLADFSVPVAVHRDAIFHFGRWLPLAVALLHGVPERSGRQPLRTAAFLPASHDPPRRACPPPSTRGSRRRDARRARSPSPSASKFYGATTASTSWSFLAVLCDARKSLAPPTCQPLSGTKQPLSGANLKRREFAVLPGQPSAVHTPLPAAARPSDALLHRVAKTRWGSLKPVRSTTQQKPALQRPIAPSPLLPELLMTILHYICTSCGLKLQNSSVCECPHLAHAAS